jgi:hypothetical protein
MMARTRFRCVILKPDNAFEQVCTGIMVDVPKGLTRNQAVDYVTGAIAKEISRYAAWEALGLGPTDNETDWNEIVT